MSKVNKSAMALCAAGMIVAGSTSADTLKFTESTTGSGSLGGTSFTDALVTFSGTGSTSNITNLGADIYAIVGLPVSVNVAGVGSASFTDTVQLVANDVYGDIGLGDTTNQRAIIFAVVPTAGYNLSTSFGPASGSGLFNSGTTFGVSSGTFDLTSVGTTTYQATVSSAPEPATWGLMLIGLAAIGSVTRSRRAKAVWM